MLLLVLVIILAKIFAMLMMFTVRMIFAFSSGEGGEEALISLLGDYFNLWIWALEMALPR